jgi:hypothetical protein
MGFGIGLAALVAAEALEAVAVPSKSAGFESAIVARHFSSCLSSGVEPK